MSPECKMIVKRIDRETDWRAREGIGATLEHRLTQSLISSQKVFRNSSGLTGRLSLNYDARLLFLTRFTRLFAYGALSVVLVFYLSGVGLSESRIGMLLTLTLLGDTVVSLVLTTRADRVGRRRMLMVGCLLMGGAGLAFTLTSNFVFLLIAGTIGVISPSGNELKL